MLIMPKAEYLTWHCHTFQGRGVTPDVAVTRTPSSDREDDLQLKEALRICGLAGEPLSGGFVLSLRFEQPIDCFLRLAGRREYRPLVTLENCQPVIDVGCMIAAWLGIQLQFGTNEGTPEFRDQLLSRIR